VEEYSRMDTPSILDIPRVHVMRQTEIKPTSTHTQHRHVTHAQA